MTNTITNNNNNNIEIYSTVPQIYDYLSIQGLNTKFGLNSTNFEIYRQGEKISITNVD